MSFRSRFPNEVFYTVPHAEVEDGPKDYYPTLFRLSQIALRNTFDISVEHPENILDQPAIYAANHVKFADSLIMSMVHTETTHLPMRFVVKQELANGGGLDNEGKYGAFLKWFMEHTKQIPVDREGPDSGASAIAMIRKGREAVRRGESIGIHPGRTRIDDEQGLPLFEPGVGALALNAKAPIVPVALKYGEKPKGIASRTPMEVIYGEPIVQSEITGDEKLTSSEKAKRMAAIAESRVADMLGVHQTGKKATLRKHHNKT